MLSTKSSYTRIVRASRCLCKPIAHPHLLVRATSERFLPAWASLGAGLASENHWLQPMLVLTVHRWPALVSVGGLLSIIDDKVLVKTKF